jgi:hypothetical protein
MNDSELKLAREKLYGMSNLWERDSTFDPFWILGTKGNFLNDGNSNEKIHIYSNKLKKINGTILENFGFIYETIKKEASSVIGKCDYVSDILALPVFQIFGCRPYDTVTENEFHYYKNYSYVHTDNRIFQIKMLKQNYKIVNDDTILSLTLCIELPKDGGGIFLWTKEKDILKHSTNNAKIQKLKMTHKYFDGKLPAYIPYKEGNIFIFQSNKVQHTIAQPQINNDNDRRITIQAFAIKCDGIWRMFF